MSTRSLRIVFGFVVICAALFGCNRERGGEWVDVPSNADAPGYTYVFNDDELQPMNRTPAGCAHLAAFGLVQVPIGLALVLALILAEAHRRRSRVERAFDARAPLRNGRTVLFGVVEEEQGSREPFVSVAIHQRGREWSNKGRWSHAWREERRDVRTRAFFVVRDDGTRVRVEPDDRVVLHDDLSRVERTEHAIRVRVAELAAGERVHITGTMHGVGRTSAGSAYRAAPVTPVLRRPGNGRMVISTEAPGTTEADRTRFHRWWAAGLLVVLITAIAVQFRFDVLALDGRVLVGHPVATRYWEVWVKPKNSAGYWDPRYAVRVRVFPNGDPANGGPSWIFEDDCSRAAFQVAHRADAEIPFIVSSHASGYAQIGARPVLTIAELMLGLVLSVSSIAFYAASALSTRPWYQKRRVIDSGAGRL